MSGLENASSLPNLDASSRIWLTHVCPELKKAGYRGEANTYPRAYRELLSGRFPAQQVGNRWSIQRADLPKVAEALGLVATA